MSHAPDLSIAAGLVLFWSLLVAYAAVLHLRWRRARARRTRGKT